VRRFEGRYEEIFDGNGTGSPYKTHEMDTPTVKITKRNKFVKAAYPYGFDPTFYKYRLDEPQHTKKPQNVFVCSMADLFGDWVPDEWIREVFRACEMASRHRYFFLTKNPARYIELGSILSKRFWYGTTITKPNEEFWYSYNHNCFLSIEPIQESFEINNSISNVDWVIVGAETGNRKGKVIPKREWIETIVEKCRKNFIPIFLKDSLAEIWGEPLIQEYPWEGGNS
jgi:protein gp37